MSGAVAISIDLNGDLGEGCPHDAELMPFLSSANIACGGHAGDAGTMAAAVALARRHGVAIGAHPGHPDRGHFGRRELPISPGAAADLVVGQVAALAAVAGTPPRHVKLHGGLYHQAARDELIGAAVAAAVADRWPGTMLFAPAGSRLGRSARQVGLRVAEEAFVDRGYRRDGSLVPRGDPGGVITDPVEAAARAVRLATAATVEAIDGGPLALRADTLCLHGDGPAAVAIAAAVRAALGAAGIRVAPP